MPRPRPIEIASLAGFASVALIISGATSGAAKPASVTDTDMPNCHNTIQGVVVDQGGLHVDDVNVEAYNAKGAGPVASALTYADSNNDISHGYFALCVGKGTFTLHLSKTGYDSDEVQATYVAHGHVRSLGELTLNKKRESSRTKVTLDDDTIRVGDSADGTVRITAGEATPTGKWKLMVDGEKEDGGKLDSGDRGRFDFSIKDLSKGSHSIQVSYAGDLYVKASDSSKVGIDVVKKKKKGH